MVNASPAAAFAPGSELPSNDEIVKAVADSVNVAKWPPEPPPGSFPFNRDACIEGFDAPTGKIRCVYGDPKGTDTIVVYGDSHAGMWAPPLGVIAKQKGWRLEQMTLRSCAAADYPVYSNELKRHYTECDEFRTQSLARIEELQPAVVFISGQFRGIWMERDGRPDKEGTAQAWADGLAVTINRLKAIAGRVVVIGDIAYSEQQPVDCLTAHPDDVRPCNTPRSYAELVDHNRTEQRIAEENGAEYIETVRWLCTETVCPAVIAGMPTHKDRAHITVNLALWLRKVLGEAAGLLP